MHVRTSHLSSRPVRAVLLVLGMVAALLAAAFPAAGPAHAAVPDRWGFAYLDNATPPPATHPTPHDSGAVGPHLPPTP